MSDALLTEISKKLSDIAGLLSKAGAAPAAAAKTAPAATATDAAKTAAATAAAAKKADEKKKADATAAAPAKPTKPASGGTVAATTKAPGGKHTLGQVRDMIRKVAADVDRQSAKDILLDDGGGVERCDLLKPENYDKVYEACEVLLHGEGNKSDAAPAEEDDLM